MKVTIDSNLVVVRAEGELSKASYRTAVSLLQYQMVTLEESFEKQLEALRANAIASEKRYLATKKKYIRGDVNLKALKIALNEATVAALTLKEMEDE